MPALIACQRRAARIPHPTDQEPHTSDRGPEDARLEAWPPKEDDYRFDGTANALCGVALKPRSHGDFAIQTNLSGYSF